MSRRTSRQMQFAPATSEIRHRAKNGRAMKSLCNSGVAPRTVRGLSVTRRMCWPKAESIELRSTCARWFVNRS